MESAHGPTGAPAIGGAQPAQPGQIAVPFPTLGDWVIRLALFGGLIAGLVWPTDMAWGEQEIYGRFLLAVLGAIYLLASVGPVSLRVHQQVQARPLLVVLLPVALFALFSSYIQNIYPEPAEFLFFGIFIFLVASAAVLNVPPLQRADVSLALILVAVPLLMPVVPDTPFYGDAPDKPLVLRAIAFLPPVLLLLLTSTQQKQRLNLLFICALLALWYAAQFGALPSRPAGGAADVLAQLMIPVAALYVIALAGRFEHLGFSFRPTLRQISVTTANAVLLATIFVPLGLVTGALVPAFSGPPPLDALGHWLGLFLLKALPEEMILRGALITYLRDDLRFSGLVAAVVSVILSGVTNWSGLGWLLILNAIASAFYARIFLATGNVVAAGVVHATLIWTLWLLFGA
jgi:membrane protease YdiL (CAAX protease family)